MAGKAGFKSSGEHLEDLRRSLTDKADEYKEQIDADEILKDSLLKELRAITMKLEETERRLSKLNAAKKEYTKTFQEVEFALNKLEDASQEIQGRIDTFANAGSNAGDQFLSSMGVANMAVEEPLPQEEF